jgi:hypothetical protein
MTHCDGIAVHERNLSKALGDNINRHMAWNLQAMHRDTIELVEMIPWVLARAVTDFVANFPSGATSLLVTHRISKEMSQTLGRTVSNNITSAVFSRIVFGLLDPMERALLDNLVHRMLFTLKSTAEGFGDV